MTADIKNKSQKKILFMIVFIISTLFYLTWYFHDGIIMSVDGPTYISMESGREPFYPIFLWIFRTIFGESIYLNIVVIIQCIIAGLAATCIAIELKERFQLAVLTIVPIVLIEYGITLLNRFVAQRKYSYYNSICSEALAYSFWIFFMLSIMRIIYDHKTKDVIVALVWCIMMTSVRKQMLIGYCVLFLAVIYHLWRDKKAKSILIAFVLLAIGLLGNMGIDRVYNFALRGEFVARTGDATFVFGNEIYVADESMAEHISDEENKQIFLEILQVADEQQYRMKYAPKGWMGAEQHYSDAYDRIKFDVGMGVIREHSQAHGVYHLDFNEYYEAIANEMTKELLVPCIPGMLKLFVINVISGFVTTVLKVHRLLNWIALFMYIAYIALIIYILRYVEKEKRSHSSAVFAIFVLLAIGINVCFTSLTIYCQMRYMLYNTAFFYQAGLVMLIEAANIWGTKKNEKKNR